jgi:oligopeptide transport system ATP-binding protein
MSNKHLIEVKNLKKEFKVGRNQVLRAVDNISFSIGKGETLGLVGESGCGKSTTGKLLIDLIKPTSGEIIFSGSDISTLDRKEKKLLKKRMQMIFQDPYGSLNPRMKVMDIIAEGLDIFGICKGNERSQKVYELLEMVGLKKSFANRFAHEFSGGQRQRIGIARAISLNPEFIICDEPISALDVSIQAQVVNLLNDLQKELALTYLFISHDIKMVKLVSDRIAVMYLGKIVEIGDSINVFSNPQHPYSKVLISSVPIPDPKIEKQRKPIETVGDLPTPINRKKECVFVKRCQCKKDICMEREPELKEISPGHFAACHFLKHI